MLEWGIESDDNQPLLELRCFFLNRKEGGSCVKEMIVATLEHDVGVVLHKMVGL